MVGFFIWRTKHYQFHHGHFPHRTLMKRGTAAFSDHSCETSSDSSCSLQSLILLLALTLSPPLRSTTILLFHCICQAATQEISAEFRIWPRIVINWCISAVGKMVSQSLRNRQAGRQAQSLWANPVNKNLLARCRCLEDWVSSWGRIA